MSSRGGPGAKRFAPTRKKAPEVSKKAENSLEPTEASQVSDLADAQGTAGGEPVDTQLTVPYSESQNVAGETNTGDIASQSQSKSAPKPWMFNTGTGAAGAGKNRAETEEYNDYDDNEEQDEDAALPPIPRTPGVEYSENSNSNSKATKNVNEHNQQQREREREITSKEKDETQGAERQNLRPSRRYV